MKRLLVMYLIILCALPLNAQNYNEYLVAAQKHLNEGNYENAQKAYNVYKSLTGKTVSEFENINLYKIQEEYNQLVFNATECFKKKHFIEARKYYDEAIRPGYSKLYNKESFEWIGLCDSIIVAQSKNEAITPQLAKAFEDISLSGIPAGISNGAIVFRHNTKAHTTIITTEGGKTELDGTTHTMPWLFSENKLATNMNDNWCYIDKEGSIVLNYRKSGYNDLFQDDTYVFYNFEHGCAIIRGANGSYGLIDSLGHTILFPQKLHELFVLKDRIVLHDGYYVSIHYRQKLEKGEQISTHVDVLGRYNNGLIKDVTEDYFIFSEIEDGTFDFRQDIIYDFNSKKIYSTGCAAFPISSNSVILKESGNGFDSYSLWNFEKNIKIGLGKLGVLENANRCFQYGQPIIVGSNCYDINGELLFSLPEDAKAASCGFTDDYMLIRKPNNKYCYIDKKGKILADYEFEFPESAADTEFYIMYSNDVKLFGDGFGLIVKDDKWGVIDRFGTTTFDY